MHLTQFIMDDIRQRLRAGQPPVDLRLEALAKFYRVSTQPVRTALAGLVKAGVLERNGRRHSPVPGRVRRSSKPAAPTAAPPGIEEIHRKLSRLAVELSLQGEEMFLREETTAEQLGVSRSAAREALQRLHGEGIVEHTPRRGWRVRGFSHEDMHDFLEVREALEVRALTLAWARLESADLEKFFANNDPARGKPDNRLHDYWIERSRNRYIQRFFTQHAPYFAALFDWEDHDRTAAQQTCQQHRAILTAVLNGNREAAITHLVAHIHDNHPVLAGWPARRSSSSPSSHSRRATKAP